MKKIIIYLFVLVSLFLIYHLFDNHHINYVSIGDNVIQSISDNFSYNDYLYKYLEKENKQGTFNNYFSNSTIKGLIEDIKKNRTIRVNDEDYYFKKVLRESDVLVISVGMEELIHRYDLYNLEKNNVMFKKMFNSIQELIREIKLYTKGKIIFLGYYNPTNYYDSQTDEFFFHVNEDLKNLMHQEDIIYIELYELIKNNQYKDNQDRINSQGVKEIANLIKKYIN